MKIFGERNTGTNVLAQLIELNSDSKCLPGTEPEIDERRWGRAHAPWIVGRRMREWCFDRIFSGRDPLHCWKHCATYFEDVAVFDGVLVVTSIRHPASWLISLFRNPYQCYRDVPNTLEEFVDFRWETNGRERLGRRHFTPLELYEAKMDSYVHLTERLRAHGFTHRYVRFEDIVLDQQSVFEDLASSLSNPKSRFEPIEESTKEKGVFKKAAERRATSEDGQGTRDLNYYRAYYGGEQWRHSIRGLETTINSRIDWARLQSFGYRPL